MSWDSVPTKPNRFELFVILAVPAIQLLTLIEGSSGTWLRVWVWAFAAVSYGLMVPRWIIDYRTFRAWERWDEAGGPDADAATRRRRNP